MNTPSRPRSVFRTSPAPHCLALASLAALSGALALPAQAALPAAAERAVIEAYGQIPLAFEENRGQSDAAVQYLAHGQGFGLFLTAREAVIRKLDRERHASVLRLSLVNGNAEPRVAAEQPIAARANYLVGNDPAKWHTDVAQYGRVRYDAVYPGIDLVYYGNHQQLEYDFLVAPGAEPSTIRLRVDGAERLALNEAGELLIHTTAGDMVQRRPVVYQQRDDGQRVAVEGRYALRGANEVGFELAAYDRSLPLVIDPVIVYASYLGGSSNTNPAGDQANAVSLDPGGNAYIVGFTTTADFPTLNGEQNSRPETGSRSSVFVTKVNSAGGSLGYSTYIGGTTAPNRPGCGSNGDVATSLGADGPGSAILVGYTDATDFPTHNPIQPSRVLPGGTACTSGFVMKLVPSGNNLVYGTYLTSAGGGSGSFSDGAFAVVVEGNGTSYTTGIVAGTSGFPTTAGTVQPTKSSSGPQVFVTKLMPFGQMVQSTFLETGGPSRGTGIAIDGNGNTYVTGVLSPATSSFTPTAGAAQPTSTAASTGFVARLDSAFANISYASYLGGSSAATTPRAITADSSGNFYVTGSTAAADFPLKNALFASQALAEQGFVVKYNAAGAVQYASFLGGTACDGLATGKSVVGNAIKVNSSGNMYIAGTASGGVCGFPVYKSVMAGNATSDSSAFVSVYNPTGSAQVWSTLYRADRATTGNGLDVDGSGNVFLVGATSANALPVVNAFQTSKPNGDSNAGISAYIAKISSKSCGDLGFSSTSYKVNADVGSAAIPVNRSGGASCTGLVGAHAATGTGGTATIANYTPVNGTVSWTGGDLTAKSFAVPVLRDPNQTANLTVQLLLGPNGSGDAALNTAASGADFGSKTAATLTIVPLAPAAPAGLSATAGKLKVSLAWTAVPGAAKYQVFQGTSAGGEGTTYVKSTSSTTASISGLTPGTTYYFVVKGSNSGGVGSASSEVSATPKP